MSSVHFTLATHSGIRHTVHVVKRSCTAAPLSRCERGDDAHEQYRTAFNSACHRILAFDVVLRSALKENAAV